MTRRLRNRTAVAAIAAVLLLGFSAYLIPSEAVGSFQRLRAMQRLVTIPGVREATFENKQQVGPADSGDYNFVAFSYTRDENGPFSTFHLLWLAVRGVPRPNLVTLDLEAPVPPEERTERFAAVARVALQEPVVASAKEVGIDVKQSWEEDGKTRSFAEGVTHTPADWLRETLR